MIRVLFIGDICGRPGRQAVTELLPIIVQTEEIQFVVANADNAAGGKGMTEKTANELLALPIDVITAGNHVWEKKSIFPSLDLHPIVRPYNIKEKSPGKGYTIVKSKGGETVAVIHLQGRVFMEKKGRTSTSPFKAMDQLLAEIPQEVKIVLVDMHAEATAEKRALGWYLNGRVSCLVGTHTHVQTADEEILSGGTAYITDLGMTGPHHSVIGIEVQIALERFLSDGKCKKFKIAKEGVRLEGLIADIDEKTGRAVSVKRLRKSLPA